MYNILTSVTTGFKVKGQLFDRKSASLFSPLREKDHAQIHCQISKEYSCALVLMVFSGCLSYVFIYMKKGENVLFHQLNFGPQASN